MADSSPSYKQLKEDFVSNLSGGSVGEINLVISIAPVRPPSLVSPPRALFVWHQHAPA